MNDQTQLPLNNTAQEESSAIDTLVAKYREMENPDVLPEDSMAEAGRKILGLHFVQMVLHEPGTRAGVDIEELHDMRVATRRMRAAMSVFSRYYIKPFIASFENELRSTGRALGPMRDLDVLIDATALYMESQLNETQPGLESFLLTIRQERQQDQRRMNHHLESPVYQQFIQSFADFLLTKGKAVMEHAITKPDLVRDVAPILIYQRLAAVRAYNQIIPQATVPQFHALRIQFKRLRYVIEFFIKTLGPEAATVIDEMKIFQDHLGELHDADVACQSLDEFMFDQEKEIAPSQVDMVPVTEYFTYRKEELERLISSFPSLWEHFMSPDFNRLVSNAVMGISA